LEATTEIPRGGRVRDAHGAERIEIDRVVAEPLEVFDPAATGEDVEGDVQDMVGFVIGEMAFEEMEIVVDGGDQAGPPCQQQQGADAARSQALDTLTQFVVDVGGGEHGNFTLGFWAMGDPVEDSPSPLLQELALACSGLLGLACGGFLPDNHHHSKPSEVWKNRDLNPPAFFQDLGGFSSFSWAHGPRCL